MRCWKSTALNQCMHAMKIRALCWMLCTQLCITHASGTPSCAGLPNDVYFPHPSDCTLYYQCDNGQAKQRQCAPPTIFDVNRTTCVSEDVGECSVMSATATANTATEDDQTTTTPPPTKRPVTGAVSYQADVHFATLNYTMHTSDGNNPRYTQLAEHCVNFTQEAVLRSDSISHLLRSIRAVRSRSGSVIVETEMTFQESNLADMPDVLQKAVDEHLALNGHTIAGYYVDFIKIINPLSDADTSATVLKVVYVVGGMIVVMFVVVAVRAVIRRCQGTQPRLQGRRDQNRHKQQANNMTSKQRAMEQGRANRGRTEPSYYNVHHIPGVHDHNRKNAKLAVRPDRANYRQRGSSYYNLPHVDPRTNWYRQEFSHIPRNMQQRMTQSAPRNRPRRFYKQSTRQYGRYRKNPNYAHARHGYQHDPYQLNRGHLYRGRHQDNGSLHSAESETVVITNPSPSTSPSDSGNSGSNDGNAAPQN